MTSKIRLNDVGTILEYTVIDETNTPQNIASATIKQIIFVKPDSSTLTKDMSFSTDGSDGILRYVIEEGVINVQGVWKYQVYFLSPSGHWTSEHYSFIVENSGKNNLVYLLPYLRLRIGDTNPSAYRYLDDWLVVALNLGFKKSERYFNHKYLIDEQNNISRNPNSPKFIFPEPPILESADEYLLVLFAAIIVLEQSLENSAWDAASWKDAEISYSNLESFRSKNENLNRLITELNELVISPNRRLAQALKSSLPGYTKNEFEHPLKY